MKEKRLTRRESQDLTRARLLDSAEKLFASDGFDATPVERIASGAGFSRGAFYSNFADKDELFLELLDRRRQEMQSALHGILQERLDAGERFELARDWYMGNWKLQQWTILRTEFHLRALRNKTVAKRVAKLLEQELSEVAAILARYYAEAGIAPLADTNVEALALFSLSYGLGLVSAFCPGREMEARAGAARGFAYERMLVPPEPKRARKPKNA